MDLHSPVMSDVVLALFLAFFLLDWAVEVGLAGLNLMHAVRVQAEHSAGDSVHRAKAYTAAKLRYGIVRGSAGAGFVLLLLFSGALPWLERVPGAWGLAGPHLFVAYLAALAASSGIAALPFTLYRTFGIETRFGFNRATPRLWLVDRLKGLALAAAIGVPFLYGVHAFMAGTGPWWWVWLLGFLVAVQLILSWLFPAFIQPLFNTFRPLPAGDLRTRMEDMARRAGFRTRGIFLVDASRRSGHSNAYFTGLFRPRIVLFDTLLDEMSADESLSVLAHEVGHFRMGHVYKCMALNIAGTALMLWVLSLLVAWPPLFHAFGFPGPSLHAAVALVILAGGSFTFFLAPAQAWLSRRWEYAADAYSLRLMAAPAALRSALARLNDQNLADPSPHPWYVAFHYSHPTLAQRTAAIDGLAAATTGFGTGAGNPSPSRAT